MHIGVPYTMNNPNVHGIVPHLNIRGAESICNRGSEHKASRGGKTRLRPARQTFAGNLSQSFSSLANSMDLNLVPPLSSSTPWNRRKMMYMRVPVRPRMMKKDKYTVYYSERIERMTTINFK